MRSYRGNMRVNVKIYSRLYLQKLGLQIKKKIPNIIILTYVQGVQLVKTKWFDDFPKFRLKNVIGPPTQRLATFIIIFMIHYYK